MRVLLVICAFWAVVALAPGRAGAFDKTFTYDEQVIGGFTVLVSSDYAARPDERAAILGELARQVDAIAAALPPAALDRLRATRIWVEYDARRRNGGEFHVSRKWLEENGLNPAKARGVEVNFNFYRWRQDQPSMLLHELAHAWHHTVVGANNPGVNAAFAAAQASGAYDRVRRNDGRTERAYAMTDAGEYFAELTEAYFGENDYEPFTREQLRTFDPRGYELMRMAWDR